MNCTVEAGNLVFLAHPQTSGDGLGDVDHHQGPDCGIDNGAENRYQLDADLTWIPEE